MDTGELHLQDGPERPSRITGKKGFVLRNEREGPLIELIRAKYVLLGGMTLRGCLKEAITVKRCEHVRVACPGRPTSFGICWSTSAMNGGWPDRPSRPRPMPMTPVPLPFIGRQAFNE